MQTRKFLTIDINKPMLAAQTAAKFSAFSPNQAELVKEYAAFFASWLECELLVEINDSIGRRFDEYMDKYCHDKWQEADKRDEEFFETLMWPACEKCKLVDSVTGYHGGCVRRRRPQCSCSLAADRWVESERYEEALEQAEWERKNLEEKASDEQEGASHE